MKYNMDIRMELDDTKLSMVQTGHFTKYWSKGGICLSG